jgi:hypothetical protein
LLETGGVPYPQWHISDVWMCTSSFLFVFVWQECRAARWPLAALGGWMAGGHRGADVVAAAASLGQSGPRVASSPEVMPAQHLPGICCSAGRGGLRSAIFPQFPIIFPLLSAIFFWGGGATSILKRGNI